jgi:uncharacterized protein (DUF2147 family)
MMGITLNRLCNLSAVAFWTLIGLATAHADARGLWLAQDGAKVLVGPCGAALCGTLVSAEPPTDPATGRPPTDKNNPDQARRNRPLVGVVVLISMIPDGPGKWAGQLYNVDSGATLPGHLLEIDDRTIRIEGCSVLCGGQNMSRIR